jgi:hypothetical protein
MIPYRSSGSARAIMARTLTTVGTRGAGRMPILPAHVGPYDPRRPPLSGFDGAGGRAPARGPGLNMPYVPYEAAKRMGLGALGAAAPTSTVGSAARGASVGASIGSAVPLIGTAIGAILGGIGGAISAAFSRQDQEVGNFDQAVALWQQNPNSIYSIGNKYLPLAGLFDLSLKGPHIPIYQKYGRMGEQKFVTDMITKVYQAAQQGQITANDTPLTVMSRVIQPWIDSWGFGPMVDPHADMINRLMIGMIADYVGGMQRGWTARGGDYPFASLPAFALPPAPVIAAPAPPPVQTYIAPAPVPPPVQTYIAPAPVPVATPVTALPLPTTVAPGASIAPATATAAIVTPPPAAVPGATVPPTAVPPAGFNVVANDANGNPIFANPQGVLYQWTGTSMVQFTGTLGTNSSQAAQMQAAIQNALAQGYSSAQAAQAAVAQQQAAGQTIPPAIQTQVAEQASTTAAAATVAPTTAGLSLTGTTGLLAVGLTILGVMFATARPAPGKKRSRA